MVTRYVRAPGFVARRIAGEMVVVPVVSVQVEGGGSLPFFVLNDSASTLWNALESPRAPDELVRILTDAFEVSAEQAGADVELFLRELGQLRAVQALEAT